jgi:TonB family protein
MILGFASFFFLNACSNDPAFQSTKVKHENLNSTVSQDSASSSCNITDEMRLDYQKRGVAYVNQPIVFPDESKRLREAGKVTIKAFVNEKGKVESAEISESSGIARLDQSALEAVRKWCFIPALKNGVSFSAWVLIPISFRL